MTKKKNIQASNQNVCNTEDGIMNSENDFNGKVNLTNNVDDISKHIKNAGVYSGQMGTRNKR